MKTLTFIATLTLLGSSTAYPQQGITLTDLNALRVVVKPIPSNIKGQGFFEADFQSEIELRCRQAGMKIVDSSDAQLVLIITVQDADVLEGYQNQKWSLFYVGLGLTDVVQLNRPMSQWVTDITIWEDGYYGIFSENKTDRIRQQVHSLTTKFLNDWMKYNNK